MVKHLSHWGRSVQHWFMVIVLAIVPLIGFSSSPVQAQGPVRAQEATVTIDGVLQSIHDNTWNVSGISIQITAQTIISGTPTIGSTVHIVATTGEENTIIAKSITVVSVTSREDRGQGASC